MNEVSLQWVQIAKFFVIGAFAGLYGFGGVSGKWKRRIIAPLVYASGIVGFSLWTGSFKWSLLYSLPLLFIGLTIGYGAIFLNDKIIKRSRAALVCSLGSFSIFLVNKSWSLLFLHIAVCVLTSVVAGVWNQTSSARSEETLIGASYVTIPMFII